MFIYCEEKIIDTKQIRKLFYPEEEKSSKGVLHDFQYETSSAQISKKKDKFFLIALSSIILYTAIISFISISTYKLKNHRNISTQYEKRQEVIKTELDKVLCNLFFSCLDAAQGNTQEGEEAVMAGLTSKSLHLQFYFKNFLEEYFNITEECDALANPKIVQNIQKSGIRNSIVKGFRKTFNLEKIQEEDTKKQTEQVKSQITEKVSKKVQEFYWPYDENEKVELVVNFFTGDFYKTINKKYLSYPTLQKEQIIKALIPDTSIELQRASIDDILSLEAFQKLEDTFNVAKIIAEKIVLNSVFQKEDFKNGINNTKGFLLFLQSLVEMDESYTNSILGPKG